MRAFEIVIAMSATLLSSCLLGATPQPTSPPAASGAPSRSVGFRNVKQLATVWQKEGPDLVWERRVGEGYAAITAEGGQLFVVWHEGKEDVVAAIDSTTGATHWETRYSETFSGDGEGPGPHVAPVLIGSAVVTISGHGKVTCWNRTSGEILWSKDLRREFGAIIPDHGYAAAPLVYEGAIILPVGGPQRRGVVALRCLDGELVWNNLELVMGFASPRLIEVLGETHVTLATKQEILGFDPLTGALRWRIPHRASPIDNFTHAPEWDGRTLWTTVRGMGRGDGTRALRCERRENTIVWEEVYYDRRTRVEPFVNVTRSGSTIYTSVGTDSRARLLAMDMTSGEILWQEPGFQAANLTPVGEESEQRFIALGEKGALGLIEVSRAGLVVLARAQLATDRTWTRATVDGCRLFVRDRRSLRAFDLSSRRP